MTELNNASLPKLKESMVIREEADNYGLLFDPDTGCSYVINTVSLFVLRHLDGTKNLDSITELVREEFHNVPDKAGEDVKAFIDTLSQKEYLVI